MAKSEFQEAYDTLGTQEKRTVMKLVRALGKNTVSKDDMKSICRKVHSYTKDEHAPKRKSAYIVFYSDVYPELKKKHPKKTIGEIASVAGKQWKELDTSTREAYKKKARATGIQADSA
jgi:Glu-tRNA(Gln) amidotransferase subunit E-like FAD-binding protein